VAVRLEDVVDRAALEEFCRSVQKLLGIGVRVYSSSGGLLSSAAQQLDLCRLANEFSPGRLACGNTVSAAKSIDPGAGGEVTHPCFTGLAYRIVSLDYETHRVGRVVLGPFVPGGVHEAPSRLLEVVPNVAVHQAKEALARVPRLKPEAVGRIARHLKTTLELIIFSSHKAYVTSKLHLYSVTENFRQLEEKTRRLEQALARLKEVDRLKSNLLATVSHELRTPLTSIIGYSEMLAEGIAGTMSPEQSEFVRTIHSNGEQLLGLIKGLLDLSKLESGTMSLKEAPTEIGTVLADVVKTLTPVARKKEVELVLQNDCGTCDLAADADRLRQVFTNLVDNAVKFTPKDGTVALRTSLVTMQPDGEDLEDESGSVIFAPFRKAIQITVSDTGIGIPRAERTKVFDAFYQIDSSSTREYGGTGLGLSIVKRIVEAHGGSVRIDDNVPTGAVFVVTLPTARARRGLPSRVPPAADGP
jgi:signal transduction histidine kinase